MEFSLFCFRLRVECVGGNSEQYTKGNRMLCYRSLHITWEIGIITWSLKCFVERVLQNWFDLSEDKDKRLKRLALNVFHRFSRSWQINRNRIFAFSSGIKRKEEHSKETFHSKIKFRTQNNCVYLAEKMLFWKQKARQTQIGWERRRKNPFLLKREAEAASAWIRNPDWAVCGQSDRRLDTGLKG